MLIEELAGLGRPLEQRADRGLVGVDLEVLEQPRERRLGLQDQILVADEVRFLPDPLAAFEQPFGVEPDALGQVLGLAHLGVVAEAVVASLLVPGEDRAEPVAEVADEDHLAGGGEYLGRQV